MKAQEQVLREKRSVVLSGFLITKHRLHEELHKVEIQIDFNLIWSQSRTAVMKTSAQQDKS